MNKLSFRIKILILTLLPLMVISTLIIGLVIRQVDALGINNVSSFSDKFYELRRNEIKNYTNIAITSLKHLTTPENRNDKAVQKEVKQTIRDMTYGNDGYFFGYEEYTTRAHPDKRLEGVYQEDLADPNGVKMIKELYNKARDGGGYSHYVWMKPSLNREVAKIGYGQNLEGWDWWLGTGLYVDDIESAITQIQASVDQSISTTLKLVLSISGIAIVAVGFIGARMTLNEGRLADKRLQLLSHKAVEAQEEERRKVAYELQKNICQSLVSVRSKLEAIYQSAAMNDSNSTPEMVESLFLLDETVSEVSRISGELSPVELEEKGLAEALRVLVNEASKRSDISYSFKETGAISRLRPEVESSLYRIAKEALDNIIKHSNATKADIRLGQNRNAVTLKIQDNGSGFDQANTQKKAFFAGVGLNDMNVRAEVVGAKLSIFSSKGAGTLVKVGVSL